MLCTEIEMAYGGPLFSKNGTMISSFFFHRTYGLFSRIDGSSDLWTLGILKVTGPMKKKHFHRTDHFRSRVRWKFTSIGPTHFFPLWVRWKTHQIQIHRTWTLFWVMVPMKKVILKCHRTWTIFLRWNRCNFFTENSSERLTWNDQNRLTSDSFI